MARSQAHHRKTRFHRFMYRTALVCILTSSSGLLLLMRTTDAANINFSLRIGDPEPSVETQASVPIVGGGSASRLAYLVDTKDQVADNEVSPSLSPAEITINLYDGDTIPTGGSVSRDLRQDQMPIIRVPRPFFRGTVGVAEALLFIELHSIEGRTLTSTFNASADGSWEWQTPRDLSGGAYVFYVTAFDPTGEVKLGIASLHFTYEGPLAASEAVDAGEGPRTSITLPPSLVAERSVLFDIRVDIFGEEPHVIQPGDDIMASVSLLNIGSPGYIVDATVHYMIIDDVTNKVYFEESETIGVSTKASYLKIFRLKPTMPHSAYRLEASVSYGDTEAFTSDRFVVEGPAVIAASPEARINVSTALEVLIIVLALALLIMYVEYHTVEALQGIIRQITEDDLRKNGFI